MKVLFYYIIYLYNKINIYIFILFNFHANIMNLVFFFSIDIGASYATIII